MSGVLHIGPFAFALDRLVALVVLWLFVTLVVVVGKRAGRNSRPAAWTALLVGLAVARIGYVVQYYQAFSADWLSVFAVWQGGFALIPGLIAAAAVLVLMLGLNRVGGGAAAGLVVVALLWVGIAPQLRPAAEPLPAIPALTRLNGGTVDLKALHGKPVILNLWATWCPPCRRELPMLAHEAKTSAVPILLIDQGELPEKVRTFLTENGIDNSHVLIDERGATSSALHAQAFPTTVFINADGMIVKRHMGEISRAALQAGTAALLKESS